jgi:hypothetical protein
MEKFIPVVVIKELSETDKILTALKNECAQTRTITLLTTSHNLIVAQAITLRRAITAPKTTIPTIVATEG